jgi:hypothetical protein
MDATNLEARELLGVAELEEGDEEAGRQACQLLKPALRSAYHLANTLSPLKAR